MPADPKKQPPPKKDAAPAAPTDGDRPTPDGSKLLAAEEGFAAPAAEPPPLAPAEKPSDPKAPPPPAPQAKGPALYRVWAHGSLQRNDETYASGATLTLHEDEAAQIPCLERC